MRKFCAKVLCESFGQFFFGTTFCIWGWVLGSVKGPGRGWAGLGGLLPPSPPSLLAGSGLGWAGLGWAGLGWAGAGLGWGWAGLGWAGLGWAGLGWAGLGWAGLGWRVGAGGWGLGWRLGVGGGWAGGWAKGWGLGAGLGGCGTELGCAGCWGWAGLGWAGWALRGSPETEIGLFENGKVVSGPKI